MAVHSTHRLRGRRQQPTIDHKTKLLEGRLGRFGQHSHIQKGGKSDRLRECRQPTRRIVDGSSAIVPLYSNVGGLKPDHIAKSITTQFGSCHRSAITTIDSLQTSPHTKSRSSPVSTSNRVVAISLQATWNPTNSVNARWMLLQPRTLSTTPFPSRSRQF
jgi:hypothetical protein